MSSFSFRELMVSVFPEKTGRHSAENKEVGKSNPMESLDVLGKVDAPFDYGNVRKKEFGVEAGTAAIAQNPSTRSPHVNTSAPLRPVPEACGFCTGCTGCSSCTGCSGCTTCTGCSYCTACSGCTSCSPCSGSRYEEDPGKRIEDPDLDEILSLARKEFGEDSTSNKTQKLAPGIHSGRKKETTGV